MTDRKKEGHHAGEHKGTMTHKEAGHMGGEAHHKCRGAECHEKAHEAKSEKKEAE